MSTGALAALVGRDQAKMADVVRAIQKTVVKSYQADGFRGTGDETKRRIDICLDGFKKIRGDLLFSIDRTLDELPAFLRNRLDGVPWDPSAHRAIWAPGQGDPLLSLKN